MSWQGPPWLLSPVGGPPPADAQLTGQKLEMLRVARAPVDTKPAAAFNSSHFRLPEPDPRCTCGSERPSTQRHTRTVPLAPRH